MSAGFHRLEVAEVVAETAEAMSIRFHVPEALRETFQFRPGQHLTLRAKIAGDEVRRNYSLCVAPEEGELKVTVKRIAGGLFSNWANENVQAGAVLDVMPPHGSFTWAFAPGAANHYVGFAGGSGITPIVSLLKTALIEEPESRFTLFYGNRDSQSVIFLEALAGLKNRFIERLEVHHFLAEESEDIELFNGMLDRAKCDEILEHLIEPAEIAAFFICGPGPMMDVVEDVLKSRGVAADRVLVERFSTSAPSAQQLARSEVLNAKAAGVELQVVLDGRRTRVRFDPAKGSILESVQAAGLHAPYACRGGVCTTCRAKLLSGKATMLKNYGLTDEEVAQGYVLTCQAMPAGGDIVLSYDE